MKKVEGTTERRFLFRCYEVLGVTVKVDGTDIHSVIQKSLREMIRVFLQSIQESLRAIIGIVPFATSLFNGTFCTNITYGKRDVVDLELDKVVVSGQSIDIICLLPRGCNILVGYRRLKSSKGERESTAIARVLWKDSPIVVFDKTTSVPDIVTEKSIQQVFDVLGQEHRILLTGVRVIMLLLYCIQSLRIEFNRHLMYLGRKILA
ncbi:hypothetical protein CTEN210_17488 [Chaetoceros tenuissimus]|uniref:Uncharacterized protein n=1 Tax=Chaetoceros tenuissimus TaxID=426638 RepID=A0AAD3DBM8_9STRA|nr:hypothetical protein CTEN210_17488 [Chaetoceros tenuissimus]